METLRLTESRGEELEDSPYHYYFTTVTTSECLRDRWTFFYKRFVRKPYKSLCQNIKTENDYKNIDDKSVRKRRGELVNPF